jgi:hypothetical protein
VLAAFAGIWHCLRVNALFTIWKLRCKFIFADEVSSIHSFCCNWKEEVYMQLLAEGFLLIKDAKELDALAYSDFSFALLVLRKRI